MAKSLYISRLSRSRASSLSLIDNNKTRPHFRNPLPLRTKHWETKKARENKITHTHANIHGIKRKHKHTNTHTEIRIIFPLRGFPDFPRLPLPARRRYYTNVASPMPPRQKAKKKKTHTHTHTNICTSEPRTMLSSKTKKRNYLVTNVVTLQLSVVSPCTTAKPIPH